jgi:hypothetical protein
MKIEKGFNQIIYIKEPNGFKSDGTNNYLDEYEGTCRWEDKQTTPHNSNKSTINYDAKIWVDQELPINSLVRLDSREEWYIITETEIIPDIKGRIELVIHVLRRNF